MTTPITKAIIDHLSGVFRSHFVTAETRFKADLRITPVEAYNLETWIEATFDCFLPGGTIKASSTVADLAALVAHLKDGK